MVPQVARLALEAWDIATYELCPYRYRLANSSLHDHAEVGRRYRDVLHSALSLRYTQSLLQPDDVIIRDALSTLYGPLTEEEISDVACHVAPYLHAFGDLQRQFAEFGLLSLQPYRAIRWGPADITVPLGMGWMRPDEPEIGHCGAFALVTDPPHLRLIAAALHHAWHRRRGYSGVISHHVVRIDNGQLVVDDLTLPPDTYYRALSNVGATISRIANDSTWLPTPGIACLDCPFSASCEFSLTAVRAPY